jgi:hypothetical protein
MYSAMAIFKSSIVWGLFEYTEFFIAPQRKNRVHRDFLITLYKPTATIVCKTLLNFDPVLLGRDAASVDKWLPTFRRHMSPSYSTVQSA